MRIYGVSCNAYHSNYRNDLTFGFWQPAMSSANDVSIVVKKVMPELKGHIIWNKIPVSSYLGDVPGHPVCFDKIKVRHVNINGSNDKIERTSFNYRYYDDMYKCEQDLYPDGDLITRIWTYANGKKSKSEEFIENIS